MEQLSVFLKSFGLDFNPIWLVGLAPLGAILIQARGYIVSIYKAISNTIIGTAYISPSDYEEAPEVKTLFLDYIRNKHKLISLGQITYKKDKFYSYAESKYKKYLSKIEGDSGFYLIIYKKYIPILVKRNNDKNNSNGTGYKLKAIYPKILMNFDKLMIDAFNYYQSILDGMDDNKTSRFFVKKIVGTSLTSMYKSFSKDKDVLPATETRKTVNFNDVDGVPLSITYEDIRNHSKKINNYNKSNFVFDPIQLELTNKIKAWFKSGNWFRERNLPWKIGILLYGYPGTGKTSFVRSIALDLDIPVYQFDLATLTNEELYDAWSDATSNAPCITLFEDIDSVFHKRKNVSVEAKLTFDSLLNCIDGVQETNGIITVITTNDISKIDSAIGGDLSEGISSRPGRVDYVYEFGKMEYAERRKLVDNILDFYDEDTREQLSKECEGYSPAQFKHRCNEEAIKYFMKIHA